MKFFIFLLTILPIWAVGYDFENEITLSNFDNEAKSPTITIEYPKGGQSIFTEIGSFAHQTGFHHARIKYSFKEVFDFLQDNLEYFIELREYYLEGETPNADIILAISNDTESMIRNQIRQLENLLQSLPDHELSEDHLIRKRFIGAILGAIGKTLTTNTHS
jgi:hypothetical protein